MATVSAALPEVGARLTRNAGWNMAGQAIPLLAAVAALPVVVRELGPSSFGLLALVWLILGYFNLFDLGLGRATVRQVAEAVARSDTRGAAATARASVAAHLALGVTAGVLLWLSVPWLVERVFAIEAGAEADSRRVFRALAVALPFVLATNAHRSILEALQRFGTSNALRVPFATLLYVTPLAGVLLGWTLVGIVWAMAATRMAAAAAYSAASVRALRRLAPAERLDLGRLRALAAFGGWVALTNAVVPLVVYLDRLAITRLHSLESLAYYVGAYEVASKALLVPIAVSGAALPIFSGIRAGERALLAGRAVDGTRLVLLLVTPVSAALILCSGPLLGFYLGTDYAAASTLVFVLLNVAVFLNAVAFLSTALVEGVGRPDVVAKYHVAELPFYLGALVLLTSAFGIAGAAFAWLLRMVWTLPFFAWLALRVADVGWRDLAALGMVRDAAFAAGTIGSAVAVWWWLRPGWSVGLGAAAALLLLFGGLHAVRPGGLRVLRGGSAGG